MNTFLGQFFQLIASPTGSLLYHLTLFFSVVLALEMLFTGRPLHQWRKVSRPLLGLGLLLLGQVVLFIVSTAIGTGESAQKVLPPVDRLIGALSLLAILWLWALPGQNRIRDLGALVVILPILILFINTLVRWDPQTAATGFNGSTLDLGWDFLGIILSLAGIVLVVMLNPENWGFGVAMLALHLVGYVLQAVLPLREMDFSGTVRLMQVCAYPLLPFLVQPYHLEQKQTALAEAGNDRRALTISITHPLEADWMKLVGQQNLSSAYITLARAIAASMQADLCLLAAAPDAEGVVAVRGGFDRTHEEEISQTVLKREQIPVISNALEQGVPLEMPFSNPELTSLSDTILVKGLSNMLMVPLIASRKMWGGVILFSPFSHREWNEKDQAYLTALVKPLVSTLEYFEGNLPALEGNQPILEKPRTPAGAAAPVRATAPAASAPARPAPIPAATPAAKRPEAPAVPSFADALAKASSEAATSDFSTLDVNGVVDGAVATVNPLFFQKNIALEMNIPDDLPQPDIGAEDLLQTLIQMLKDAVDRAKPEGTVTLRIMVEPDLSGEICFTINVQGTNMSFPIKKGK